MSPAATPLILNVDDTESIRYAKSRALSAAGYRVKEAGTGAEALDFVRREKPALVLLDIKLPDMSGLEVCEIIKRDYPHVLVLQISATFTQAFDRVRGLESGADSYLVQPVTPDELAAGVAALLRGRRGEAMLRAEYEDLEARLAQGAEALRLEIIGREQAEAALRQSQKLEALGHLTSGIAHDFNNLLMAIIGNIEILDRRLEAGRTDVRPQAANALEAARRAAALTQRLLTFARQQPFETGATEVAAVMRGMQPMVDASIGDKVRVKLVLPDDLWTVACDAHQLENAVLNLAINARDAMPGGGALVIAASNHAIADDDPMVLGGCAPGDYVRLSVVDEGVGMPPDVLAQAFDPFFTTKPRGKGTGLGLSMIYSFARQSGGCIDIRSKEGVGTEVSLFLPRVEAEADVASRAAPDAGPRGQGQVILVVEDEALVRSLLVDTLAEGGYDCRSANTAEEALERLAAGPAPDLLVTDVGLPGPIDGHALAQRARKQRPDLKVLFISGHALGAPSEPEVGAAAQAHLTKPFDLDALTAAVRALLV